MRHFSVKGKSDPARDIYQSVKSQVVTVLFGLPSSIHSNHINRTGNRYVNTESDLHVNDAARVHVVWCFFILYAHEGIKPPDDFVGTTDPVFMWFCESGGEFIVNPAWVARVRSMAYYVCGKVIPENCSCGEFIHYAARTLCNRMGYYRQAMASS